MNDLLNRLKQKGEILKLNQPQTQSKNVFNKIEEFNGKKIYHTKLFSDFYTFGINKKQKHKFLIALNKNSIPSDKKIYILHLFSTKGDDAFLGIKYSIKKLQNPLLIKNMYKDIFYTVRWCVCMEFRFKTGYVICYITNLYSLLRKDKVNTVYYKTLLEIILEIEKQVYAFYNKNLPEGGLITKWIKKT
ncbi:DUF226 domain-containing protein [Candidatus Borreliella tachyglossi]|uniref:DUF226 domain-containing protein n=1 Tax=Candidatus Borreliella tachyglossi TaxID=1964448 RepID=UPI004041541D